MNLDLGDGVRSPWYCHCKIFAREHVCSGVLATQILLREVTVPITALFFQGRKRRGPGTPRDITRGQRYAHVEDDAIQYDMHHNGEEEHENDGEGDGENDGEGKGEGGDHLPVEAEAEG